MIYLRWRDAILAATVIAQPPGAAAASLPSATEAARLTSPGIAAIVEEAAARFVIPAQWIYAVMRRESAGEERAVSPKGASGLMQIMPATWAGLRVRYRLGNDIFDPHDNILAGAAYLRELFDRYGSPGFLAAYNAGPGRYEAWLSAHKALPEETLAYVSAVASVLGTDGATRRNAPPFARPDWPRSALFPAADPATGGKSEASGGAAFDDGDADRASPKSAAASVFAAVGHSRVAH